MRIKLTCEGLLTIKPPEVPYTIKMDCKRFIIKYMAKDFTIENNSERFYYKIFGKRFHDKNTLERSDFKKSLAKVLTIKKPLQKLFLLKLIVNGLTINVHRKDQTKHT